MRNLSFITLLIVMVSFSGGLKAQEEQDIFSMSLDELLSLNLSRTGLVTVPHFHIQGEWMLTYKYHRMDMSDIQNATLSLSTSDVLNSYMISPVEMTMNMHMLGAMYGYSKKWNFMAMVNYMDVSMNLITQMNMNFTTSSKKLGDTKLNALYNLGEGYNPQFFASIGVSLPTGDINLRGNTPMGNNQKLPYPMQLGSGTVDPMLALTYIRLNDNASYGMNVSSVLRLYNNSNDYHLGNQYSVSTWYSQIVNSTVTAFVLTDGIIIGDIVGADPELNPMMAPTADPKLRGGTTLSMGAGVNLSLGLGSLNGSLITLQYSKPYYQNLDGPQLEKNGQFSFGLILKK